MGQIAARMRASAHLALAAAALTAAALAACTLPGLISGQKRAPVPVISPAGGDYSGDQSVTISDGASGATVYYTTDGSPPTTSSPRYGGAIPVVGNGTRMTIEAMAVVSGETASPVAVASFVIAYGAGGAGQTAAPQFSPAPGTYSSDLTGANALTISDGTSGATIYYTTDGTAPTTSSTRYAGPIQLSGDGAALTIEAMATGAGEPTSPVVTARFTINYGRVSTPDFSLGSGAYLSDQSLSISDLTSGATIYYTVTAGSAGTTPTASSSAYAGPISIGGNGTVDTVEAIAVKSGMSGSTVSTVTISISYATVATPQILPPGGIFTSDQTVDLSTATSGATISYTVTAGATGAVPSTASATYGAPLSLAGNGTVETIEARATAPQMIGSAIATATLTISRLISAYAGTGTAGFTGDGGPATSAELSKPVGVALDGSGNLYIADYGNNRIREVSASSGAIHTVAGDGTVGYTGNGGPATSAALDGPNGVAVDAAGDLFIADTGNQVVREVYAATGVIATVAGDGTAGYSGDGGPATAAELSYPDAVAVDSAGDLFICDEHNNVIREVVAATGDIKTVAGDGTAGYSGDGGLATAAELNTPTGVALDSSGDLYIADHGNNVVREVNASTGDIATVAGDGTAGFSGDQGSATSAGLSGPSGLFVDGSRNLFIVDEGNDRVREVRASTGIIVTVAGDGSGGSSGDNGPAASASLFLPTGVTADGVGDLFIADASNNRIREVHD